MRDIFSCFFAEKHFLLDCQVATPKLFCVGAYVECNSAYAKHILNEGVEILAVISLYAESTRK
jgi:Leu/Phe-tRNA-protein transferase